MSRHRQKYVDDYEDYYEDYDEDYDEFGAKPIVTTQKSKPKKNKKKAVIASEGLVSGGPIVNVALPNSISSKTSATAAQLPSDLAKGVPALLPTHPADILPIKPAQGALLDQKTLNSQLFAGLSDDDTEVPRHASHPIARSGDARDACLPCLAVIVAGHVDAGKSTLVGNLLYQTGRVSSRVIEAHQREAERSGKASFHFAWVTDESASEREHGVTISAATKYIQTSHREVALLDAPGHKDYVPNMIASAALADAALLVIPATSGEFETAISASSQTREHAVLLKAMGCNNIVVVVNKMDRTDPPWNEDRYNRVTSEVRALLASLQFPPTSVQFIPVSGLTGANVETSNPAIKSGKATTITPVCMSDVCPWYHGPALLEVLDTLPIVNLSASSLSSSLRAVVSSVSDSSKGCDVAVKILRGTLQVGQTVGFHGGADGVATIKSIWAGSDHRPLTELLEREQGKVTLSDRMNNGSDGMGLNVGTILFKGPPKLRPVNLFKAAIITMPDMLPPIINGSEFELFILGKEVICYIKKICGHRDATSRAKVSAAKCVAGGRSAVVHISTSESVMVEEFANCRAMGRFVLRSHGKTIGVGIIEKLY